MKYINFIFCFDIFFSSLRLIKYSLWPKYLLFLIRLTNVPVLKCFFFIFINSEVFIGYYVACCDPVVCWERKCDSLPIVHRRDCTDGAHGTRQRAYLPITLYLLRPRMNGSHNLDTYEHRLKSIPINRSFCYWSETSFGTVFL